VSQFMRYILYCVKTHIFNNRITIWSTYTTDSSITNSCTSGRRSSCCITPDIIAVLKNFMCNILFDKKIFNLLHNSYCMIILKWKWKIVHVVGKLSQTSITKNRFFVVIDCISRNTRYCLICPRCIQWILRHFILKIFNFLK
jgi:hypothetical protein